MDIAKRNSLMYIMASLLMVAFSNVSVALNYDDTDIFFSASIAPQNLLFIIDTSGSMKFDDDTGKQSRLVTAKEAFSNLLDQNEMQGLNVGVMGFQWVEGSYVVHPVSRVSDFKQPLKDSVNNLTIGGGTPLGESVHEAMRYLRGDPVFFGSPKLDSRNVDSHSDSTLGGIYISPVTATCQKNHIILMTDGQPSEDANYLTELSNYPSRGAIPCGKSRPDDPENHHLGISCLDKMGTHIRSMDASLPLPEKQEVSLHTVAFALNDDNAVKLLKRAASNGGGGFYSAGDSASLLTAFLDILTTVNLASTSSAAPSVPVSSSNRFSSSDRTYLNLYQAAASPGWGGNLKSYELRNAIVTGTVTDESGKTSTVPYTAIQMVGKDNQPVLDPETSLFKPTAYSRWSKSPDGGTVTVGGARDRLSEAKTKFFVARGVGKSRRVTQDPTKITRISVSELGASSADERDKIVRWALNINQDNSYNQFIADPMHSEPSVVAYNESGTVKEVVFYSTNMGMLHAVDAETGDEQSVWMPEELLPNLKHYFDNIPGTPKVYGLDGFSAIWHQDNNGDLKVDVDEGDKVILYLGMRRGGSNYYAIDITDYKKPVLKWKIIGGLGPGNTTKGFDELAQTWSKPLLRRVAVDTDGVKEKRQVLFFSGGYDPQQDRGFEKQNKESGMYNFKDTIGRAIFMVDASTGEKLWSAALTGKQHNETNKSMKASFPASPAVADISGNGLIDLLVAVDAAGRVWRADFADGLYNSDDFATLTMIANLRMNKTPRPSKQRRHFFSEPVLSLSDVKGRSPSERLSIIFGSGRRPDLTSTFLQDRFYVLRQEDVYQAPDAEYKLIKPDDLANIKLQRNFSNQQTNTIVDSSQETQDKIKDKGFYLDLGQTSTVGSAVITAHGERVLGRPTVVDGVILFNTYMPPQANSTTCGTPQLGTNRLYILDLIEGSTSQVFEVAQNGPIGDVPLLYRDGKIFVGLPIKYAGKVINAEIGSNGNALIKSKKSDERFIRFWIERASDEP